MTPRQEAADKAVMSQERNQVAGLDRRQKVTGCGRVPPCRSRRGREVPKLHRTATTRGAIQLFDAH